MGQASTCAAGHHSSYDRYDFSHTTICLVQTGALDPIGSADDLANGDAVNAAVTSAELAEMTDEQTVEACKTMVGQCNCGAWETQKTGDLNLRYACHNAKCCMFKLSSEGDTKFQYCNDDSFCDNDSSFHAVINDDGDTNEWVGSSQLAKDSSAAAAYLNPGPSAVTKTASFGIIHGPWSTPMQWVSKTFKLDKHVGMRVVARLWVIGTGTNTGYSETPKRICHSAYDAVEGKTLQQCKLGCAKIPECPTNGFSYVEASTQCRFPKPNVACEAGAYSQGAFYKVHAESVEFSVDGVVRERKSNFALKYHYVGEGLCTGNLVRVYDGEADNPGTTVLERREACASACANKKTAVSTSPTQWDVHPGVVLGFALHTSSDTGDTGRCYCEMKVCEGLSAK